MGRMRTEMELALEQTQQGTSYEARNQVNTYAVRNTKVLSDIEDNHGPSDAMHNPPQPLKFDESNANVLERFYTSVGNPVKEILFKLNLPDHRILKDGGEDFCYSDTEHLSRSEEVLKLKNIKKDALCQAFKAKTQGSESTQERIAGLGEAKTTSTPTSPTTQAQVKYVSESISYLKFEAKTFKDVYKELRKFVGGMIVEGDLWLLYKGPYDSSYDVLIIQDSILQLDILSREILLKLFLLITGRSSRFQRILKDGGEGT
ncbi:hypothetical protein Tco_1070360 [Tanacetum coccineum]|uniref:Uncharacterized protein n=1 Tax=Tanacetum coccineum TaxID=301880 RepID=A0ABQ5HNC5_9ASTR